MLSKATISRLPGYLEYLKKIPKQTQSISATTIAKELCFGEVQVRKDLSAICSRGKPKIGYSVSDLRNALESALGTHSECEAVIVGAGKLGSALLGFDEFDEYGLRISCAFDLSASEEKQTENGKRILPLRELPSYCSLHQTEIGIITVPAKAAQEAANLLIKNGIRAILCFAVCRLTVPANVTVQYENLALSLAHLKNKVQNTH